jgi:two-component system, NarL family, response regulator DegU
MKKKVVVASNPSLRIAIVEDHLLIRKGLVLLINSFEGMQVVLEASNGQVFLDLLPDCVIDVVLLDIQMPIMNGYEACKHLLQLYPDVKVLVVSQLTTKQSIHRIMSIGAHGYFTKNSAPEELESAIRSLYAHGYYFGSELGSVLREAILWDKKNVREKIIPDVKLSDRELEIIGMMCKEMTSEEIAAQLFISVRSVEAHRRSMMEKTYSQNVIGIILYVLKRKLLVLEEL